jgi:hypothetical protein
LLHNLGFTNIDDDAEFSAKSDANLGKEPVAAL